MNINKYLYEIIDDYKNTNSEEEKSEIFKDFCSSIWSSKNKRRVYTKTIKFRVINDSLDSEIGQIFNAWSEVDYIGYKAMTKDTDWCSLIRQKVNNLYTRYFDENVILNKDYMDLLKTPKNLYYRWINGEEMNPDSLTKIIDDSIHKAEKVKCKYQKQKTELSWIEYKEIIEELLLKIFNNCKLIEQYEKENKTNKFIYDFINEDNFYISYICTYLEHEMKQWIKKKYKIKSHKPTKHCEECGKLIEKTNNRIKYCNECAVIINREKTRINMNNIRNNNV